MDEVQERIVVFGATGRQGGSVVNALLAAGKPVRAIVRDLTSRGATELRDAGADVVKASLDDAPAVRSAVDRAGGVFSVLPANLSDGDEVRFGMAIADAATAGGVDHFIYSSGASADDTLTGVPRFDAKPRIEAHVRELPISTTIIRPMIFMEMLLRPEYGLAHGRFSFLVKPEKTMQLIAVRDIGRIVAAIFANRARFAGETITLAGDTVSGQDLGAALSQAAGRSVAYSPFSTEFLASKPDFACMAESIEHGPLSRHADLALMRELDPQLLSLQAWLKCGGPEIVKALEP